MQTEDLPGRKVCTWVCTWACRWMEAARGGCGEGRISSYSRGEGEGRITSYRRREGEERISSYLRAEGGSGHWHPPRRRVLAKTAP